MTWLEKYELLLKERLITKDIMDLTGWSHGVVREFRINLVASLKKDNITLSNNMKIPTEFVLEALGKDMQYFERKMIQENKLRKIKKEMEDI